MSIKKENNFTQEMMDKYNVDKKNGSYIFSFDNKSGYINLDVDKSFLIEDDDCCTSITNSKICISLWKKVYSWHITVF